MRSNRASETDAVQRYALHRAAHPERYASPNMTVTSITQAERKLYQRLTV
jgi:hypothetical protein